MRQRLLVDSDEVEAMRSARRAREAEGARDGKRASTSDGEEGGATSEGLGGLSLLGLSLLAERGLSLLGLSFTPLGQGAADHSRAHAEELLPSALEQSAEVRRETMKSMLALTSHLAERLGGEGLLDRALAVASVPPTSDVFNAADDLGAVHRWEDERRTELRLCFTQRGRPPMIATTRVRQA